MPPRGLGVVSGASLGGRGGWRRVTAGRAVGGRDVAPRRGCRGAVFRGRGLEARGLAVCRQGGGARCVAVRGLGSARRGFGAAAVRRGCLAPASAGNGVGECEI